MKGTPFYSGDFGKNTTPPENRMNAWPLVYYRDPSLSVLWPIFEFTDDHAAVRPFYSVYGLDRPEREYNVLWPLVQVDRHTGDGRVFPYFWGDDYRVGFPLYWHFGQPWEETGGIDTFFPFWYLNRRGPDHYTFFCPWPLGKWWENGKKNESGSMIFPIYYHSRDAKSDRFLSLPWIQITDDENYCRSVLPPLSFWWANKESGNSGSLVLPFYLQNRNASGSSFFSLPWMSVSSNSGDSWHSALPPLSFWWTNANAGSSGSTVLPLYWHSRDEESSRFFSLLWLDSREKGGKHFSAALPLAYWWGNEEKESSGSTVLPFYWHERNREHSSFYSLPWWSRTEKNGDYWQLLFPFYYRSADKDSSITATLLWAKGKSAESEWQSIIPFAYWDRHKKTLVSPLWASWHSGENSSGVAPLALSWWTSRHDQTRLWMFGGLARASWGQNPAPQYAVPLFYRNPKTGTFLSPLWATWKNGDANTSVMPWTLSFWSLQTNSTDLWLLGGLGHASWGEGGGSHHLFPLYYRDAGRRTLITPLFGWKNGEEGFFYPLTPIAGTTHSPTRKGSWVFPLYSHIQKADGTSDNHWLMFLGGNKQDDQSTKNWFLPFYYYSKSTPPEAGPDQEAAASAPSSTFWCLPFNWFKTECRISPAVPASTGTNEVDQPAAPETTNQLQAIRTNIRHRIIFPFWSYYSEETPSQQRMVERSFLPILLYDSRHEVKPDPKADGGTNDYTRSRVLWRLWHYERSNGNVSVDVFPAITYDRKTDGYKKTSFLWRFYRYERSADGSRKLDILFIPLMRSGPQPRA